MTTYRYNISNDILNLIPKMTIDQQNLIRIVCGMTDDSELVKRVIIMVSKHDKL